MSKSKGEFTCFQAWAYDPCNPCSDRRYSLTVNVERSKGAFITQAAYERAVNAVGLVKPEVGLYLETESKPARIFFDRVLVLDSRSLPVFSLRLWLKSGQK